MLFVPYPPPAQGPQPPGAALRVPSPIAAQGRRHSGAFSPPGTIRAASRGAKGPFVGSWVLLQRAGAGTARPGGSLWGRSPPPAATVPPCAARQGHEQHVGSVEQALGQILKLIPIEHSQLGTTEPPSAGAASWRTPPCSLGTLPEGRGSARRRAGGATWLVPVSPSSSSSQQRHLHPKWERGAHGAGPAACAQSPRVAAAARGAPGETSEFGRGETSVCRVGTGAAAPPPPSQGVEKKRLSSATTLIFFFFFQLLVPVGLPQAPPHLPSHAAAQTPAPSSSKRYPQTFPNHTLWLSTWIKPAWQAFCYGLGKSRRSSTPKAAGQTPHPAREQHPLRL